jgi:hypothetical protein
VKNGVETGEVAALDIAKIFVQGGDVVDFTNEPIVSEKIAVQAHNLMGGLAQQLHQNRADVSMMASHQYTHTVHAPTSILDRMVD